MSHLALTREFRTDDAESRVEVALRREFGRPVPGGAPAPEPAESPVAAPEPRPRAVEETAPSDRVIEAPLTDVLAAAKARRRRLSRALAAYEQFLFIASKLCNLAERERFELIFSDPNRAGQSGERGKCSS